MKKIIKYSVFLGLNFYFPETINALESSDVTCSSILGPKTVSYLTNALTAIQIVGIIMVIFFGMTEFLGAILEGKEEANKKSIKKLTIRVGVAVILLIVPALLKLVLTTFGISDGDLCIL